MINKKLRKNIISYILIGTMLVSGVHINITDVYQTDVVKAAEEIVIPSANEDINTIGANMPYTRYDSKLAVLGGGATISESSTFEKNNIATQASEQSYIKLSGEGAYAEWTMSTVGNGVTIRYTMPDSSDGCGLNGSLDVYVNNNKMKTVDLSSYHMWQYFYSTENKNPSDVPIAGATATFAFDEVHFVLNESLQPGDVIKIQSTYAGKVEYGVDFIEVEQVEDILTKPENSYSIVDYGATPNDGKEDDIYINNCINAAIADGKDVYFPAGTFELSKKLELTDVADIKISGAGIWHTNIIFTSSAKNGGGIVGNDASNVEICNMYIGANLRSRYSGEADYKCFSGVWENNSYIHDIWIEHFEAGLWIGDYNDSNGLAYSDDMIIAYCRIRNNYGQGVGFCQGTSYATVYNSDIRNNGDDGLFMWNSNYYDVKNQSGNTFCYNTIEFIWNSGGIAIYGGASNKMYNNYIADTFMAAGIRYSTELEGYKFNNCYSSNIYDNILVRTGTSSDIKNSDLAALDFYQTDSTIKDTVFIRNYVYDSQHDAIRVIGEPSPLVMMDMYIYGTGKDEKTTHNTNNGALFKFESFDRGPYVAVSSITYANIAYDGIFHGKKSFSILGETNLGQDYKYSIPTGAQKIATDHVVEEETTTEEIEDDFILDTTEIISDKVNIKGFGFNYKNNGIRTYSSTEPEIDGKFVYYFGNIYGIVMDGYSEEDMLVNSDSPYVCCYETTENGIDNSASSRYLISYIMTMINNGKIKEALSQRYAVRAYAILEDGSCRYSNIYEYSIFDIASALYDENLMSTQEAHDYLYTDILSVINPDYVKVEYNWENTLTN